MAFFDKIPENLFSVLSSKNKHIYVECLFIIFKAYREEVLLRKDDLVERLKSFLEVSNFSPEGEEEELPEDNNLSSIAHFILRKLEKTGWIYRDYAENFFEELIYLHDYSIKILNTLYEIQYQEKKDYNSFVHSAYNNLKNQDVERSEDAIFALLEAHKKTRELIDELKSLLNNLRKYHQMLYEKEEVREILKEHFDEFKELIDDRIYHPLKTFDSIPRYKTPIINILNSWLTDREMMDLLVKSSLKRRIYKDEGEAISKITGMINDILEIYYKIDLLLYEIDKKRASYTRASVERMQYLLNADLSIKGKIVEILKALPERENIYEAVNKNINIFLQNYIDENSLYIKKPERKIPDDKFIKIPEIGDDASDFEREMDFLKERLKNSFTRQKIYKFFKELLKGKSEILSKDIKLENDEEFIMLILGVFMHDEKGSFYDVVFEKGSVFVNGYKIPQMRIKKKV
ncbi:Wadjet anti-phage system protein JetA family protein [Thermovenabulum gondwanense]|uniref:Uncharacterized protein n=1 Tax=Thermovenabulum gondwanense TaxID=520767 RepID=A0A162MQQ0_9FIRM|nr:Wadjet anti-phage system protein JetA family protein [Thermovenabulum gondwanense]KYO66957.1 hypothetical protein ATZ99_07740 [Thermovenabulum gondwanense]